MPKARLYNTESVLVLQLAVQISVIAGVRHSLNGTAPKERRLPAVRAIQHFRPYLYGNHFTIVTDSTAVTSPDLSTSAGSG